MKSIKDRKKDEVKEKIKEDYEAWDESSNTIITNHI